MNAKIMSDSKVFHCIQIFTVYLFIQSISRGFANNLWRRQFSVLSLICVPIGRYSVVVLPGNGRECTLYNILLEYQCEGPGWKRKTNVKLSRIFPIFSQLLNFFRHFLKTLPQWIKTRKFHCRHCITYFVSSKKPSQISKNSAIHFSLSWLFYDNFQTAFLQSFN